MSNRIDKRRPGGLRGDTARRRSHRRRGHHRGRGAHGADAGGGAALAGVPCLVLERRDGPAPDHGPSACTRGAWRCSTCAARRAGSPRPGWPFRPSRSGPGRRDHFSRLDSDFPYLLDMPQSQIEMLLAARAVELGAEIRWSARSPACEQDAEGAGHDWRRRRSIGPPTWPAATASAASPGRPPGLPFPGSPNPGSVLLADLFLDGLPMTDAYGDLSDRGHAAGVPVPGRLVPGGAVRLRARGGAGDRAGHPRGGAEQPARRSPARTSGPAMWAGPGGTAARAARPRRTVTGGSSWPGTPRTRTRPRARRG